MPGRVALITGGASGIGEAVARRMSSDGMHIVIADIDGSRAQSVAESLPAAVAHEVDVSDAAAVERMTDRIAASLGRIDVLVASAGIVSPAALLDTTPDVWARIMAVDIGGVFHACRAVMPGMIQQRRGAIVTVGSVAGLVALPDRAAYCAAKAAVISLTRAIAIDYVQSGIRANCVCPGSVDSPWVRRLLADSPSPDEVLAEIVGRQPMGRLGTVDEIAAAVVYLASDEAAYITGSALIIDGGLTAGLVKTNTHS